MDDHPIARSTLMAACFAIGALNHAVVRRCLAEGDQVHHSDQGNRHLSIRYSERPAEIGIDASAGAVEDSCDNALTESIIGLFNTEVADHLGSRKTLARIQRAISE